MPFTEMEIVWLFKAEGLTDLDIAGRVKSAERTIRTIKKKTGHKPSLFNGELQRTRAELNELPWSQDAHAQVLQMIELIRRGRYSELHKNFAFPSETSFAIAKKIKPDAKVSEADWGHALVAYHFKLGMQFSTQQNHIAYRDGWDKTVDLMLKLLSKVEANWARILLFKVTANRIVIAWKRTKRSERGSKAMQDLVNATCYRERLIAFNEIVPSDPVAPFNALAIASRFNDKNSFEDLLKRLQEADHRYTDINTIKDPDFDDDFENFRAWYATKRTSKICPTP